MVSLVRFYLRACVKPSSPLLIQFVLYDNCIYNENGVKVSLLEVSHAFLFHTSVGFSVTLVIVVVVSWFAFLARRQLIGSF